MTTWDNSQYTLESSKLAKAFIAGQDQKGSTLTDLVEKSSKDNGLNIEQIRRLSRATNIKTWEEKFSSLQKSNAEDRNVEFSLSDENQIIQHLGMQAETELSEPKQANYFPDLENTLHVYDAPPTEKIAEEQHVTLINIPESIIKLQRHIDDLQLKVAQYKEQWIDGIFKLDSITKHKRWNADKFDDFEKSAIALDLDVKDELNALRVCRKEKLLTLPAEKLASIKNHLYPVHTKELLILEKTADVRKNLNESTKNLKQLSTALTKLKTYAK